MQEVKISVPGSEYSVLIDSGNRFNIAQSVKECCSTKDCALIADSHVFSLYGKEIVELLESGGFKVLVKTFAGTEENKNLDTVKVLYDALLDAGFGRDAVVISLGGGVCGDTVGFVAATYLRGVAFIQVPTTLLAMVDASVGGKVGVNTAHGKNLIGSFYQPKSVIADIDVLKTLPSKQFSAGLAECIKHAMISCEELFSWTKANLTGIRALDADLIADLIQRNVEVKASVVSEDEKELGIRAHLNFGHTFAHAIEANAGYGVVEHGEAVALGMIAATSLAVSRELCKPKVLTDLVSVLELAGLPTTYSFKSSQELIRAMRHDKKAVARRLRLVVPTQIGKVKIIDDVQEGELLRAWESIRSL